MSIKLRMIQTILRYLLRKTQERDNIPLAESLSMIYHLEKVTRQVGALKHYAQESAFADMSQMDIEEVDGGEFTARLKENYKPEVKTDHSAVAQELLDSVVKQEQKRNKRLNPMIVRSIAAKAFWTMFESTNVKWKKPELKKRHINLEDYSEEGKPVNRVEVKAKDM